MRSYMILNYLKIAYRNILRDTYYSIISFVGLTIGLAFFGLMLLTINHEFSYDSSYTDYDRIYRSVLITKQGEVDSKTAQLPLPFSDVLRDDIDGIDQITKVYGMPQQLVEANSTRGRLSNMVATDETFFEIFDLKMLFGTPSSSLKNQMSIVLSKETAVRFYGSRNPVGETFEIDRYGLFTVTGVLDELPNNSSFQFSAIANVSIDQYLENFGGPAWFRDYYTSWQGRVAHSYIKLNEAVDPLYVSDQIEAITANYFGDAAPDLSFDLQPIKDQHFHSADIQSNISALNGTPGNIQYIYIFAAIAFLILSIASINYMNLSSARSIKRTSEVGLRTVFGAGKSQVITQFLTQSILMASMSVLPAFALLQLLIPYYHSITGIALTLMVVDILRVSSFAIPSILIIGLISGIYPAIVLSKTQLSQTVKQNNSNSISSSFFRKSLVVGQFALTYIIILITVVAGRQMSFIFDKELGFEDEQVVVMEINDGRLRNHIPQLKQEVFNHPEIVGIAGLSRMISSNREPDVVHVNRIESPEENIPFSFYGFDEDVVSVMELEIVQGRNFIPEGGETLNPNTVLINQTAAQLLFPNESPINKRIILSEDESYEMTIVGVINDFHYKSLHVPIEPLVIGYIENPFVGIDDFAIRLTGKNMSATISDLESIIGGFIELDADVGLEYQFLNSIIDDYYKADQTYRKLFTIGAIITILLSIIGLIGLTAFYAEMRTKEFGIRKVLGASLSDIIGIQTKFFVGLIGLAILIGIPISITSSQSWLMNFTYRTELSLIEFSLAAVGTILIAAIPILVIAYRTSIQNPITQLRAE